jgi:hypothetical protein
MSTTALTTAGRFLVRRKRPNRPSVDNAFASSWCPHFGVRFSSWWRCRFWSFLGQALSSS